MKLSKRRRTDGWSKNTLYSKYTALIESILVLLRALAVLAIPVLAVPNRTKYYQYLAVPAEQIPEMLEVQ